MDMSTGITRWYKQILKNYNKKKSVWHQYKYQIWHEYDTLKEVSVLPSNLSSIYYTHDT